MQKLDVPNVLTELGIWITEREISAKFAFSSMQLCKAGFAKFSDILWNANRRKSRTAKCSRFNDCQIGIGLKK
jgi:hypothetical protein